MEEIYIIMDGGMDGILEMLCLLKIVPPILNRFVLLCALWINIWRKSWRLRWIDIKHISILYCICVITHVHYNAYMCFVNFKISVGIRLGIMFGNSFGLPNILARTNKLGLLPVFQNSVNMLSFDGVFCYDKHNICLWKYKI